MSTNPFLLAADNHSSLLRLLREDPVLASAQDEHGYSLLHAAASYNHLDLLRALFSEFAVDINLTDEDGETALFVVESLEAARCLVEELGIDVHHRGADGLTAAAKIASEGDFPSVATYLAQVEAKKIQKNVETTITDHGSGTIQTPPASLTVTVGTLNATEDIPSDYDPEFRRRIEELAQREDFSEPSGQAELRKLVEDAISDQLLAGERNVKSRRA